MIMKQEEIKRKIREWFDYDLAAKTNEEKNKGKEMYRKLSDDLTLEERRFAGQYLREYLRERASVRKYNAAKCEDFNAKKYIRDIEGLINFSAISKEYFGKDKTWLYQRIKGSTVNGKKAAFTEEEKRIFIQALQDVSVRISDSINSIH